jgi:hypothetical protein
MKKNMNLFVKIVTTVILFIVIAIVSIMIFGDQINSFMFGYKNDRQVVWENVVIIIPQGFKYKIFENPYNKKYNDICFFSYAIAGNSDLIFYVGRGYNHDSAIQSLLNKGAKVLKAEDVKINGNSYLQVDTIEPPDDKFIRRLFNFDNNIIITYIGKENDYQHFLGLINGITYLKK